MLEAVSQSTGVSCGLGTGLAWDPRARDRRRRLHVRDFPEEIESRQGERDPLEDGYGSFEAKFKNNVDHATVRVAKRPTCRAGYRLFGGSCHAIVAGSG